MRRWWHFGGATLFVLAIPACASVLGLDDLKTRGPADGVEGGEPDSSASPAGPMGDGATGDGGDARGDGALDATTGGPGATQLSLGETHSCALFTESGRVKCWGLNAHGELGLGDSIPRGLAAGQVAELTDIDLGTDPDNGGAPLEAVEIAIGSTHSCARFGNGKMKCWGDGKGDDPNEMGDNLPFVSLPASLRVIKISSGDYNNCVLFDDHSARCWGGNVVPSATLPALDLGAGRTVKVIQSERFGGCAILDDDELKCWGGNGSGQLGYGDIVDRGPDTNTTGGNLPAVPLPTTYGVPAQIVPVRGNFTCVITAGSALYCWGSNNSYELGTGDTNARGDQPGEIAALQPLATNVSIATGGLYYGCLQRAGEGVRCWGDPFSYGDGVVRMTIGTTDIDVGLGGPPSSFVGGLTHECAVRTVGGTSTLKCWGSNDHGQLGLGDTVDRNTSAQLGAALPAVPVTP